MATDEMMRLVWRYSEAAAYHAAAQSDKSFATVRADRRALLDAITRLEAERDAAVERLDNMRSWRDSYAKRLGITPMGSEATG